MMLLCTNDKSVLNYDSSKVENSSSMLISDPQIQELHHSTLYIIFSHTSLTMSWSIVSNIQRKGPWGYFLISGPRCPRNTAHNFPHSTYL